MTLALSSVDSKGIMLCRLNRDGQKGRLTFIQICLFYFTFYFPMTHVQCVYKEKVRFLHMS